MKKLSVFVGLCVMVAGFAGCASDGQTEQDQDDVALSADNLVALQDLGYGKVEYHARSTPNGGTMVYAVETNPANLGTTPLEQLVSVYNPTNLEMFLAISPGTEPPKELVEAHAQEAAARERESDEVRKLVFDKDAPVEKSVAGCTSWVNAAPADYAVNRSSALNYYNNVTMPLVNTSYWTLMNVTVGVCNDSTTTNAKMWWYCDNTQNGADDWMQSGTTTIAPGSMAKQYNFSCAYTVGLSFYSARYKVHGELQGAGSSIHLRAVDYNVIIR